MGTPVKDKIELNNIDNMHTSGMNPRVRFLAKTNIVKYWRVMPK